MRLCGYKLYKLFYFLFFSASASLQLLQTFWLQNTFVSNKSIKASIIVNHGLNSSNPILNVFIAIAICNIINKKYDLKMF